MADQDYLVTARKYRPSLFKELVAQEHVTETLKNAIQLDRLAHAYLFSGPRGVGKTTAARILAKAINCETPREEREDGAEPCCECESCVSFEDGRSLNVFEMDAASNNKVDDVRELREKVRIPPQGEQKKVYILDEVHMLSKQAFNALLKTLEEPPAHALFIFATTEPHKVLPTILSRCQRFDFRRIPVPDIVARLREICDIEGVDADEESLMLLARKGNGALRDALSAFDQAISLCGTSLEYSDLAQAMGVVDQDLYFDLTEHVAAQDTAGVLQLVRRVVRSGYDLQEFLVGLAEHLRHLLVVHSLGPDALEGVADSTRDRYGEEANRFKEVDLLRLLTVAGDAEKEVKNSPQPRLKLETTLLKMAQMRSAADLRVVLEKIDRLEEMVDDGVAAESRPRGKSEEGGADPPPQPATGSSPTPSVAEPTPSYESASSQSSDASPDGGEPSTSAGTEEADDKPTDASEQTASESETDGASDEKGMPDEQEDGDDDDGALAETDGDEPNQTAPSDQETAISETEDSSVEYDDLFGPPALDEGGSTSKGDSANGSGSSAGMEQSESGAGPTATVAEPPADRSTAGTNGLGDQWPEFVSTIKEDRISLGSLLGETEPVELTDEVLTVAVPKSLHRDSLREQRRFLMERLTATFDVQIEEVRFVVEESSTDAEPNSSSNEPLSPREQLEELRGTYPALEVLFQEFGAEPVW